MLSLTTTQRAELLQVYRKDPDPELRFRAHLILLLAGGYTWDIIEAMLFCSSRTLDRWRKRFEAEGMEGLTGRKRGRPFRLGLGWIAVLVTWVTTKTPRDFDSLRSRWSCAVLALLFHDRHGVEVSRETVRRGLHRGHLVYRRPRPTLTPDEPERQAKLAGLRALLEDLPDDETAVWQDEVEIHSNPSTRSWGGTSCFQGFPRNRTVVKQVDYGCQTRGNPLFSAIPACERVLQLDTSPDPHIVVIIKS